MDTIKLGKTNEDLPVIGLGTWKMGANPQADIEAIRSGIDSGMWLVDTAEMYANEEMVGRAIRGKEVFLATKVAPDHFHYDDVIRACDRSLAKLGVKQIDLYQLHWPNTGVPISETMRAMERLVDDGKIRHIGISNYSVGETEEALASMKRHDIVSNQLEYSMLTRNIEADLMEYCLDNKITVIAYSPLAKGRFFQPRHADLLRLLEEIGGHYGKTPMQVALNWIVAKKNITAIPKAGDARHARENAEAGDFEISLEDMERINGFLDTHPQERPIAGNLHPFIKRTSSFWAKIMRGREERRNAKGRQ